jgi:hypothetical protein
MALAIFISNLAEIYQPVLKLYQSADHPALSPKSGGSEWRVRMADEFGGFWITTWKTRQKHSPFDLAGGGGLVWLIPPLPTKEFLPFLLFCFVL